MNEESPTKYQDSPAYADRWIIGYVLLAIIALHFASLPGPADSAATRNPSSWSNR
jgi:hypothetical protein